MTSAELERANKIQEQIKEIDNFIFYAERARSGKLGIRKKKFIFRAHASGVLDAAEMELDTKLKNKVLEVLRDELKLLKVELSKI